MSYTMVELHAGFRVEDHRGVTCFLPRSNGFGRMEAEAVMSVLEHFETAQPPLNYDPEDEKDLTQGEIDELHEEVRQYFTYHVVVP